MWEVGIFYCAGDLYPWLWQLRVLSCSQNEPQIFCPQQGFIALALIDGFRELEPKDKSLMDH